MFNNNVRSPCWLCVANFCVYILSLCSNIWMSKWSISLQDFDSFVNGKKIGLFLISFAYSYTSILPIAFCSQLSYLGDNVSSKL